MQPSTIENVSSSDPSKKDPDAMILLGMLNETMRHAIIKNLFDPFCVMAKYVFTKDDGIQTAGNTYIFNIKGKFPDYAGMLTTYFLIEYADAKPTSSNAIVGSPRTFFECDADMFQKFWREPGTTDAKPNPTKNMYRIYNGNVYFICSETFTDKLAFNNIRFSYRSAYGVIPKGSTTPVSSFTKDDDTSNVDDELLITGTVLNYKAQQGMDFQFDTQKFNAYLEALERNRQKANLFRDQSMQNPSAQG
jgi:uncharacterized membrane protein (GlpM family)